MEAKKVLGQNFLVDKNKINEIVNSLPISKDSIVFEVGPGKGAITKPILEKAKNVIAIEIDKDMIDVLNKNIKSDKFTLIHNDILKINMDSLLKNFNSAQFVSNLPYYISTKIIFTVAVNDKFEYVSVMLQKELIDRIFAKLNTKEYGRLTVAINSLFELEKKINVPSKCFSPSPNVDSGFIVLKRKQVDFDIESYLTFVKHCFSMKRKTLLNSLKKSNFENVGEVKVFLENNNLNKSIRAESISVEQFIKLYKSL